MELKPGDWVCTESGDRGKVVHTSQKTVFVAFPREGKTDMIGAILESQLTKIDPPNPAPDSSP